MRVGEVGGPVEHPVETIDPTGNITTGELARASGLSRRQIDYWIRRGVLTPAVTGTNSGFAHEWRPEQIAGARALSRIIMPIGTDIAALVVRAVEAGEDRAIEVQPGIVIDTARVGEP